MSGYQPSASEDFIVPGNWINQARCCGSDDMSDQIDSRPNYLAKAICNGCSVQASCLEWNLSHEMEPNRGLVVGGMHTFERQRIRHG